MKIKLLTVLINFFSLGKKIIFFCLRNILKFDIITIYFFTHTFVGYCIYIFCIFYGFFGCIDGNCDMSNFCASMLAIFVFSNTLQTFILLKIPSSRKFIELIVDKNFITYYLGEYTSSLAATMAKVATPLFVATSAEYVTSWQKVYQNDHVASGIRRNYYEDLEKAGIKIDLSSKSYKLMSAEVRDVMRKPTSGIITQGMQGERLKAVVNSMSSSISSTFGSIWGSGNGGSSGDK